MLQVWLNVEKRGDIPYQLVIDGICSCIMLMLPGNILFWFEPMHAQHLYFDDIKKSYTTNSI